MGSAGESLNLNEDNVGIDCATRKSLMGECSKDTAFSILDEFHAAGGNFIDTANMYMDGESEQWLGEWMELREVRDQMVVATKYGLPLKTMLQEPSGKILSNLGGSNKKSLRVSLERSLKFLRTDYVDILYLHLWEGTASIPEIMHALDEVVKSGRAMYLGVSNWPAWTVVKANEYARQHGLTPFVAYEGRWNPADREIEREVVPMCKSEGMAITAWGALGGGKFKSKAEKDHGQGRTVDPDLGGASLENFQKIGIVMQEIGQKKGTDAVAVALRYGMLKVGRH